MDTYNKSLVWSLKSFSTKLILTFSKWFSNYGLSLSRPILLILINILPFYLLIYNEKVLNVSAVSFSESSMKGFLNALGQFLYYINPLRKLETNTDSLFLTLDLCIRIISSFSLYSMIRATRRFLN